MKWFPLLVVSALLAGCGGPTQRCLVSPSSGLLVANGKPVEGAKITRKYHSHWYDDHVETVVHTDANGTFKFPGVWKRAMINLFHQPVIKVEMVAEHLGTNYTILQLTKLNYELFGELKAIESEDPVGGKDRLGEKDGELHFKFDLDSDKVPIGKAR